MYMGQKEKLILKLKSKPKDMTFEEALETTKIHSVCGYLKDGEGIIYKRPFRSPHHTATTVSLTGGGNSLRPGEISLA
ncbi:MAG: ATP-binding protein, partial [Oscillospiraceae bacterium]|nr:ATP-binding protein [Oscillospiraceae bacterium]